MATSFITPIVNNTGWLNQIENMDLTIIILGKWYYIGIVLLKGCCGEISCGC